MGSGGQKIGFKLLVIPYCGFEVLGYAKQARPSSNTRQNYIPDLSGGVKKAFDELYKKRLYVIVCMVCSELVCDSHPKVSWR